MKKILLALLLMLGPIVTAQKLQDGQKRWSAASSLTMEDFRIKISDENNDPVYSQFVISHAINGFDFLKKNLNQKIENVFYGNASWIDTTKVENIQKELKFQQLQFDLAEVYTRKFRKRVLENKGQITKGFDFINEISNDIMRELSKSRVQMMKDTRGGQDEEKLAEIRNRIAIDLNELEEFSYENKKAIKRQE